MRCSTGPGSALSRSATVVAALAVGALVVGASPVYAQSCEPQPGRIMLRVKPPVVDFPAPGLADFDAGYIDSPPFRVQVRNNEPPNLWTLCIRSDDSSMGGRKSINDLHWQLEGTSTWTPLSVSDQFVAQGNRTTNLRLRFRVLLDFAVDTPGVYQADMSWGATR